MTYAWGRHGKSSLVARLAAANDRDFHIEVRPGPSRLGVLGSGALLRAP